METTAVQEREVRDRLRGWMASRAKKGVTADFSDQTLVLEMGILSSLDIVEFVLFIESLRGEELDPDRIEASAFASVDTIYAAFFAGR
jgi:acyl carrier protein